MAPTAVFANVPTQLLRLILALPGQLSHPTNQPHAFERPRKLWALKDFWSAFPCEIPDACAQQSIFKACC